MKAGGAIFAGTIKEVLKVVTFKSIPKRIMRASLAKI